MILFINLLSIYYQFIINLLVQAPKIHMESSLGVIDIGDVVLMRTPTALGKMQRTFTGSVWDHVGLVIRIPMFSKTKQSLMFFEAVGSGVLVSSLESRLHDAQRCQQTVAVRRLKWKQDSEILKVNK